jgi:hypothetical protein
MSQNPANPSRRRALKLVAGAAAVLPLSALVASRQAMAADLPHVTENDPIAIGLKYKHDATQAPRTDKAGKAAADQVCNNCQFAQAEGDWVPCTIFPGKAVNGNGWCTAWAPKAG